MDLLVISGGMRRILLLVKELVMLMMRNKIGILVQFPGWASCGGDHGNAEIFMIGVMINDRIRIRIRIRVRMDLHHHHHHLLHWGSLSFVDRLRF